MHDIWNPWHGCRKKSEGCQNCYMMYLDQTHQNQKQDLIYKTNMFNYPLQKKRDGSYKIKAGELIRVCMTSDFFLEDADSWRDDIWKIIKRRKDVIFYILTKRPERVLDHLPNDIDARYENVFFNVTVESSAYVKERLEILKQIPFKHKGVMCAPLLTGIDLTEYLQQGFIEQVVCGGENYGGFRPCNFDWVLKLSNDCKKYGVNFIFIETGTNFIKDNKQYIIKSKRLQSVMAYKSNVSYINHKIKFNLYNEYGYLIKDEDLYVPKYTSVNCDECGSRLICNGCSNCGKCEQKNM